MPRKKHASDHPNSDLPPARDIGHLTAEDVDRIDTVPLRPDAPDSEAMQGFGAVQAALELEDFPMAKSDIDYSVGDIEVDDLSGGKVAVNIVTDYIPSRQYHSIEEVMRALRAGLHAYERVRLRGQKRAG
ncbi:MAG: hypothetical protein P4M08_07600 [Oligoflexia bacterium]|nr:hypothetical protein [Oligoflexia bacterium]